MKSFLDSDPLDSILVSGGYSLSQDATQQIKQMAKNMQPDTEKALGQNFKKFEASHFKTQVVSL